MKLSSYIIEYQKNPVICWIFLICALAVIVYLDFECSLLQKSKPCQHLKNYKFLRFRNYKDLSTLKSINFNKLENAI